ncbi:hypothetical protein B0H13DRAFT_2670446 [Mycena leptocephala]|nr:hypothetical protein B0H13DRAFT_2670446 [Mycena leptocephala]
MLDMATHHIASMLLPAWGHTVSYSHLAVQLLNKYPNLVITIMQHNLMVAQMENELAHIRQNQSSNLGCRGQRVRLWLLLRIH